MTRAHENWNYVEFAARILPPPKPSSPPPLAGSLPTRPHFIAPFEGEGLDGGFTAPNCAARVLRAGRSGVLQRRYRGDQGKVSQHGGTIVRPCSTSPVAAAFTLSSPVAMNLRSGPKTASA